VVLSAADWEAIEATRNASGEFDLGSAVDSAKQQVWGVQVVSSPSMTDGTAIVMQRESSIQTDTNGVQVSWSEAAGFDTNTVKVRAEGRFDLAVYIPAAIVETTLPAVAP
jgi:HK97 family phage major capsid protein